MGLPGASDHALGCRERCAKQRARAGRAGERSALRHRQGVWKSQAKGNRIPCVVLLRVGVTASARNDEDICGGSNAHMPSCRDAELVYKAGLHTQDARGGIIGLRWELEAISEDVTTEACRQTRALLAHNGVRSYSMTRP